MVAALALAGVATFGFSTPAFALKMPAIFCPPESTLCSPSGIQVLTELGVMGAGPGAAVATTTATGGTVALGTFNGAVGILGAETVVGTTLGTGGTTSTAALIGLGLLSLTGLAPDSIALKTSPSSGEPATQAAKASPIIDMGSGLQEQMYGTGVYYGTELDCYGWSPGKSYVWFNDNNTLRFLRDGSTTPTTTPSWSSAVGGNGPPYSPCDAPPAWSEQSNPGASSPSGGVPAHNDTLYSITPSTGPNAGHEYLINQSASTPAGWYGTIRATVHCASTSGSYDTVGTKVVAQGPGSKLTVPGALCHAGDLAVGTAIDFAPTNNPTGWFPLTSATVSGVVSGEITAYPDCFGPGVTPCELQLLRGTGVQSIGCGNLAKLCPNWVAESVANPSSYECRFGHYVIALDLCSAFRSPGQILPNTAADGSTVSRSAPVDAVPVTKITDPNGVQQQDPITTIKNDPAIECPLGGGDNFFTNIVPFFQSIPGWIKCMIIPKGWDRAGLIPAAFAAGAPGALIAAIGALLPHSLSCGEVARIPFHGTTSVLNTCDADWLPIGAKGAIGSILILGLGALVVRRILWAVGSHH